MPKETQIHKPGHPQWKTTPGSEPGPERKTFFRVDIEATEKIIEKNKGEGEGEEGDEEGKGGMGEGYDEKNGLLKKMKEVKLLRQLRFLWKEIYTLKKVKF